MNENNITFQDLGLPEPILKALEQKGYGYPTKVQAEAIPPLMDWRDVIAKAPTGTGKTFAFGIPMLVHVDRDSEDLQGLILAPTRELAIQIGDELRGLLSCWEGIRVASSSRSIPRSWWPPRAASWITISARTCAWTRSTPSSSTRPTACWTWASSTM